MEFPKGAPSVLSYSSSTFQTYLHPLMITRSTVPICRRHLLLRLQNFKLQNSINLITTYSGVYRIGLNVDKTVQIYFPGKRHTSEKNTKHVTINNTNIPIRNKAKFLGVTFDSSLSFKTHINLTASKAKHRIIRLHTIYNQSYGPSLATMLRLYKTFVRPLFEYGHIATITASFKNMNIWEGIQYRFIKNVLQFPHISRANVSKFGNLPFIQHRLLHLSKTCYNKAITHNTAIQHYVTNHTSKRPIRKKHNTPYTIITNQK